MQTKSELDDLIVRLKFAIRPRVFTPHRKRNPEDWIFEDLARLVEDAQGCATVSLVHRATRIRLENTRAHDLFTLIEADLARSPGRHLVEQRALVDEAGETVLRFLAASGPALRHAEALEALDEEDLEKDDAVCMNDRINNRHERLEALDAAFQKGR